MIGSISVGMFKSSKLGIFIAISHYLGAIIVGIIFSFYKNQLKIINLSNQKIN